MELLCSAGRLELVQLDQGGEWQEVNLYKIKKAKLLIFFPSKFLDSKAQR